VKAWRISLKKAVSVTPFFFGIQRPGLNPEESSINTYSEKKQNG